MSGNCHYCRLVRPACFGIVAAFFLGTSVAVTVDSSTVQSTSLNEIIVTAEKKEERIQDTPIPVTAISADSLVESNRVTLQDFYTSVPNLSIEQGYQSSQLLSIRGITTGPGNPTVGVTIDDMPIGPLEVEQG